MMIDTPHDFPCSESGFAALALHSCLEGLPPAHGYASGTELYTQGAAALEVYVVANGLVKLAAIGNDGQQMVVGIRPGGRIIGLASALLGRPNMFSATTVGLCALRRVPGEVLTRKMAADPALSRYVQEELSRESYDQASQISRLRTMPARERLIQVLFQICGASADTETVQPRRVPPLLKHWEIAQLAGVTPQHLSALLKELERAEIIERKNDWIILCPSPRRAQRASSATH